MAGDRYFCNPVITDQHFDPRNFTLLHLQLTRTHGLLKGERDRGNHEKKTLVCILQANFDDKQLFWKSKIKKGLLVVKRKSLNTIHATAVPLGFFD